MLCQVIAKLVVILSLVVFFFLLTFSKIAGTKSFGHRLTVVASALDVLFRSCLGKKHIWYLACAAVVATYWFDLCFFRAAAVLHR